MEVLIVMLMLGLIGAILGGMVKRASAGFWLGLLLGPIGWIIVFLLPRPKEFVPQAPSQATTLAAAARVDALAKLADLRQKGIVTAEQFEAQKAELLAEAPTGKFGVSPAVLSLVAKGRKIEAIKQHRTETGADLKTAKEAVEAAEARRDGWKNDPAYAAMRG